MKVLVSNAPKDLQLYIQFPHQELADPIPMNKSARNWETYFDYYYSYTPGRYDEDFIGATLLVRSAGVEYEVPIPRDPDARMYMRLMTLDLKAQTLEFGQPAWWAPAYVIARLLTTLFLEGLIFYLFGMRQKRSWIAFLIINLITQIGMGLYLSNVTLGSYAFLGFLFIEAIIIIVEIVAFLLAVKEFKRWWMTVFYVILANVFSAMAGNFILAYFPY